jgi:hypothetical protein
MLKVTRIELTRGHQHDWVPRVSFTADLGVDQTPMVLTLAPVGEGHPARNEVDKLFEYCVQELRQVIDNAIQVIE